VQKRPSFVQGESSGRFVCVQPPGAAHASVVHTLPSSQFGAAPPVHTPLTHWSAVVQAFESLHEMLDSGCAWQALAVSLHVPVLHWFVRLEQSLGVLPAHAPPWQLSPTVQNSPSVQNDPFGSGAVQLSLVSLQLSAQFELLLPTFAAQGSPVCTEQTPVAQVSVPLQKRLSLQAVPLRVVTQTPAPLHAWQSFGLLFPHAALQQTPSVHDSVAWHWLVPAHTVPWVFFAVQVVPRQ